MPTLGGDLRSRIQHRSECKSPALLTTLNSGAMLLSLTHDILFITPDAERILHQLLQRDRPPSSVIHLPPIIHDMCDDMAAAWYRCRSIQEWASIQMHKVAPLPEPKLRLGGYVVPERGYPPTCRLLIIFETLQDASSSNDVQAATSTTPLHPLLTVRQESIARGLIRGLTNKELANELELSTHTVKDYVRIIMAKLNVTTRAGVVARLINGNRQKAPSK